MTDNEKMILNIKGKEVHLPIDMHKHALVSSSELENNEGDLAWRVLKIQSEFVRGHDFIKKFDKAVTIFGTARNGFKPEVYEECKDLAELLAKDGFAIFTGGGPGIMEAANEGAARVDGAQSIGININLPGKGGPTERRNQYITEAETFDYFFTRKVILSFASQIYIAFPGGFGTMDELFQMLTLIQTKKIPPVPVVLVNREYWEPLVAWIKETMLEKNGSISEKDLDLFHLFDTAQEAHEFISNCISN